MYSDALKVRRACALLRNFEARLNTGSTEPDAKAAKYKHAAQLLCKRRSHNSAKSFAIRTDIPGCTCEAKHSHSRHPTDKSEH
jgi:hypothetical protein